MIAFARGERFVCIVNFGPDPIELPQGADVLVASAPLDGNAVPQDTTVWFVQTENNAPLRGANSSATGGDAVTLTL